MFIQCDNHQHEFKQLTERAHIVGELNSLVFPLLL